MRLVVEKLVKIIETKLKWRDHGFWYEIVDTTLDSMIICLPWMP